MPNKSPENEVKSNCISKLGQWQKWGIVVDYDDVSNLGRNMSFRTGAWFMHSKKGKRDIVAWFKIGRVLWTYLIEVKAPDGGVWSKDQQDYAEKFEGLDNVIYEVVKNAQQIDITLDRLSRRTELLLDEGGRHLFPETQSQQVQEVQEAQQAQDAQQVQEEEW